jgi:2-polyprenyl-3-methyl-5-hydroxy-6-metoxy-1,4-benzoquinol methylase
MCATSLTTLDMTTVDQAGETIVNWLNHAATIQMMSLGHQTGLFDYLSDKDFATESEIAIGSGLHLRYVTEWLKSMVVSGIMAYKKEDKTYKLKPEYSAWMTRAAGPNNLAAIAQYLPLIAGVEADILTAFQEGGGVPYEKYGKFHRIMAEDSGNVANAILVDEAIQLSPEMVAKLESGATVLEFGCGMGNHLLLLAAHYPNSRFTGIDLCLEPIKKARERVHQQNLDNITFLVQDASAYTPAEAFDIILAFDAIHDQAHPDQLLTHVCSWLKEDGIFFIADIDGSSYVEKNIDHPLAPLFYTISTMHCTPVSLAQGGVGLGTMWGHELATSMLQTAGFEKVDIHRLETDIQNCYYVVRK